MEHSSVILIVDDNPEFIHMTGTLLTRNGYEVRVADSGRQALSLLDREIPRSDPVGYPHAGNGWAGRMPADKRKFPM